MPWANTYNNLQHLSRAAAETLRRAKAPIMTAWEDAAKQYVLHEQELPTEPQLRDSLPKLIDNLAAAPAPWIICSATPSSTVPPAHAYQSSSRRSTMAPIFPCITLAPHSGR